MKSLKFYLYYDIDHDLPIKEYISCGAMVKGRIFISHRVTIPAVVRRSTSPYHLSKTSTSQQLKKLFKDTLKQLQK